MCANAEHAPVRTGCSCTGAALLWVQAVYKKGCPNRADEAQGATENNEPKFHPAPPLCVIFLQYDTNRMEPFRYAGLPSSRLGRHSSWRRGGPPGWRPAMLRLRLCLVSEPDGGLAGARPPRSPAPRVANSLGDRHIVNASSGGRRPLLCRQPASRQAASQQGARPAAARRPPPALLCRSRSRAERVR